MSGNGERVMAAASSRTNSNTQRRWQALQVILLIFILGIAAYIRFVNLRDNPGWYTDEGSDLDIARHLSEGVIRYMSINTSTMLVARPLTFHAILAALFQLTGQADILTLRLLTATCSWISVGILGIWGWRTLGAGIALLAAALLAIFPSGVLYARMGFSYNVLEPLFLIALFAAWEYGRSPRARWLVVSGLALSIALSINLLTIVPLFFISAWIFLRSPRQLIWFVPVSMAGFALFAGFMLIRAPDAFLFDLAFTLNRFSYSLESQVLMLLYYFRDLLNVSMWFPLSIAGLLFALSREQLRYWGYFALFYLFFVLRSTPVAGLGYYMIIDVLPILAIGLAAGLLRGARLAFGIFSSDIDGLLARLGQWLSPHMRRYLSMSSAGVLIALIFAFPLLGTGVDTLRSVFWGFHDLPPAGITQNVSDAENVISYINQRLQPDEVILASPQIAWAIRGSVADFQQTGAYLQQKTENFPANVPPQRFVFTPTLDNAKYVIVDNLWRDWAAVKMPAAAALIEQIQHWPLELELGEYRVYRNPQK